MYKVFVFRKGQWFPASLLNEEGNGLGYEFESKEEAKEAIELAAQFSIHDGHTQKISKGHAEVSIFEVFK
ncbi:MAG: hypothetical protein J5I98_20660 [Phaeodactylibacter sp.]|nr:hypothetical protein [Phaeodactylibacter sp.]